MQYGVLDRVTRARGSDVWTYRWREHGPSGRFIYRRRVIGTVKQFKNKIAARKATTGLVREINAHDLRVKFTTMTLAQLAQHYQQRELRPRNQDKNYSTKTGYDCYLRKWIVPRWGEHSLPRVRTSEVEEWLKSLELAQATRSKIRNVMSVVFNYGSDTISMIATLSPRFGRAPSGGRLHACLGARRFKRCWRNWRALAIF